MYSTFKAVDKIKPDHVSVYQSSTKASFIRVPSSFSKDRQRPGANEGLSKSFAKFIVDKASEFCTVVVRVPYFSIQISVLTSVSTLIWIRKFKNFRNLKNLPFSWTACGRIFSPVPTNGCRGSVVVLRAAMFFRYVNGPMIKLNSSLKVLVGGHFFVKYFSDQAKLHLYYN